MPIVVAHCVVCGDDFHHAPRVGRARQVCGDRCAALRQRTYRKPYVPIQASARKCLGCERSIVSVRACYCSQACRDRSQRSRKRLRAPAGVAVGRQCQVAFCPRAVLSGQRVCNAHKLRTRKGTADCLVSDCTEPVRPRGSDLCARHRPAAIGIRYATCRCGAVYIIRPRRLHCPPHISKAGQPSAYRPVQPSARVCTHCGASFYAKGQQTYCSQPCAKRAFRDKRRALERNAFVEPVFRNRIYERDGWICQLCRRRVKRDVVVPHPLAATIDHVIPLADGGMHRYANVQLAHFGCNSKKGAGNGQLRFDLAC